RARLCGMGGTGLHRARPARPPVRPSGRAAHAPDAGNRCAAGPADYRPGGAAVSTVSAWRPPRVRAGLPLAWLAAAAALSVAVWLTIERTTQSPIHPRFAEMLTAARAMQAASGVLAAEKTAHGLMQPPAVD